jgi:hypothetical protein
MPVDPHPNQPTEARIAALNLQNVPDDKDGAVRGRVLGERKQCLVDKIIALSTLVTFISWPYLILGLVIASALLSLLVLPRSRTATGGGTFRDGRRFVAESCTSAYGSLHNHSVKH